MEAVVYKLQILYATNIQGADANMFSASPRTSDAYVVVSYLGEELARSAVTLKSTAPLFRAQMASPTSPLFSVDIPHAIVFASDSQNPEIIIELHDRVPRGKDIILGVASLSPADLRLAVGHRIVKALQSKESRNNNRISLVGGEVHVAGHLVPGEPHFVVQVLEAQGLSAFHRPTNPASFTRLIPGSGEVSPFVICYWEGTEVGRTDIKHKTRHPRWNPLGNTFQIFVNPGKLPVSCSDSSHPELCFEVYDTVSSSAFARRGSLLGTAALSGSGELPPVSSQVDPDCLSLKLRTQGVNGRKVASESSEGVLKVRLVLNDVVPSMRDWIRIGNQPKRTPPNTLDLYVLGASNLACRVGFLRVWLNGKLVPEAPTTINAPDSHTKWRDKDGSRTIKGRFILNVGTMYKIKDHVLIELWQTRSERESQYVLLGQCRIKDGMLRSPPPHRIDMPLRASATQSEEVSSRIQGSLCLYLSPRVCDSRTFDLATDEAGLWIKCLARRQINSSNWPWYTLHPEDGTTPHKRMSLQLISARGISEAIYGATIEVLYNRRHVCFAEAKGVSTTPGSKDHNYNSAVFNSIIEFSAYDISAAGHQSVWPELRLMLWKVTKKNGTRYGFLGESLVAGTTSAIKRPPRYTRRVGLKLVLPLIARRDVPEDVDSRISGTLMLGICTAAEPDFSHAAAWWGANSFPCKMLLIQVSGSRGGKDTCDARAVISWNGGYVGTTESNPADRNRCRYWSNSDFLIPVHLIPGSGMLRITVRGMNHMRRFEHLYLGHACILVSATNQMFPFRRTLILQPKESDSTSRIRPTPAPLSEDDRVRGPGVIAVAPTKVVVGFTDVHGALSAKTHHRSENADVLGEVIVRLHQQRPGCPINTESLPARGRNSRIRLRITLLGISGAITRRPTATSHSVSQPCPVAPCEDLSIEAVLIVVCYKQQGDAKPTKMSILAPMPSKCRRDFFASAEEVLVWLPLNWDADLACGCSAAFWIELRSAKQLLGIAFTGVSALAKIPRRVSETDISYLELRNRFNVRCDSVADSTFSQRLLRPSNAKHKCDFLVSFPAFAVMRARIHHRILLEEVQLTKRRGKQMTGRRAKSGPLLPLLSALAGDDIISRLRLVMTCPIFFGSNIPERLPEIGVYWCGERVGFCQYHPGKPDRTAFLLPFGRGVVSAQRNKDFLELRVRSRPSTNTSLRAARVTHVDSILLSWDEFQRLPSAQTDYYIDPSHIRSPYNMSRLVATPPIEFELSRAGKAGKVMAAISNGHGTVFLRAGTGSITLHLVVEESRASAPHAVSIQLEGLASLQDPRFQGNNMREPASFATTEGSLVGDTRWPGSIQRWPFASVFGPGPRGGSVRNQAECNSPQWHGSSPWNNVGVDLKCAFHLPTPRVVWPSSSTHPPCSIDLLVVHFGKYSDNEWIEARRIQAHARQVLACRRIARERARIVACQPDGSALAAVTLIQKTWKSHGRLQLRKGASAVTSLMLLKLGPNKRSPDVSSSTHCDRDECDAVICVLGSDDLVYSHSTTAKYDPFVLITFNGVKIGRTSTKYRSTRPLWHEKCFLHLKSTIFPERGQDQGTIDTLAEKLPVFVVMVLQPEDRVRVLYAALATTCDFQRVKTRAHAAREVFLVARHGDRLICTENVDFTQCDRRRCTYAGLLADRIGFPATGIIGGDEKTRIEALVGRVLELEIWTRTIESNALCIGRGTVANLTRTSMQPCIRLMDYSGEETLADMHYSFGFVRLQVTFSCSTTHSPAQHTTSMRSTLRPRSQFPRPRPSFYLQASKFTLEIAHGSPCHLRSLRTLDPYIKFTLGFYTQRSSVLSAVGPVGPLMTWPPGEVVTLAGWHTAPYFTFKIELFHDRSPCSDDTFGSKSIDLSCCTNQWHPQKVAISANATLSFSLTRMETGAPVPQKCQAVPQQSCSSTSQGRLTLVPEICSTYRGHDLKFYKLTATLSPGTEYWGAKCKDAREFFVLARMCGRCAKTTTKHGCDWREEVLSLPAESIPDVIHRSSSHEVTFQLWNNNFLVGEARKHIGKCLTQVGTQCAFELRLSRPHSIKTRGSLHLCVVANPAYDYFTDEIAGLAPGNELLVAIIQARNLPVTERKSDPLVTVSCNGEYTSSSLRPISPFPVWNEVLTMRAFADFDGAIALELMADIFDGDVSSDDVLLGSGRMSISMLADGVTKRTWHDLVVKPSQNEPTIPKALHFHPLVGSWNLLFNGGTTLSHSFFRHPSLYFKLCPRNFGIFAPLRYNINNDYFETFQEPLIHCARPPNELLIKLIRARGLRALEHGLFGQVTADPFVRMHLSGEIHESRVSHRTSCPIWNERYRMRTPDSVESSLKVIVFDWNLGSLPNVLGMTDIALSLLMNRRTLRRWFPLNVGGDKCFTGHCGEVELALRWIHNPEFSPHDDDDDYFDLVPNCLKFAIVRAQGFCGECNSLTTASLHASHEFGAPASNLSATHRTAHSTTRIENTRNPIWNEHFQFPYYTPEGPEHRSAGCGSVLAIELLDHTHIGTLGSLGVAAIDISCRPRRSWVHAGSDHKLELDLLWTYDPLLEPEVVLRVPWLSLSQFALSLCKNDYTVYLRLDVGGCVARTFATRFSGKSADVVWTDDLVLTSTMRSLIEKRIEVCCFLRVAHPGGVNDTLIGRVELWWPHSYLYDTVTRQRRPCFPREFFVQTNMRSGSTNCVASRLALLLTVSNWSPDLKNSVSRNDELCFDIFDDNAGEHLGRCALCSTMLKEIKARSWLDNGPLCSVNGQPSNFTLAPWSTRHAAVAASNASSQIVLALSIRLNYFSVSRSGRISQNPTVTSGKLSIMQPSIQIAKDTICAVLHAAWRFILAGRHTILHVIDGVGLGASPDSPNTTHGPESCPISSAAYCMVRYDSVELGCTSVCALETDTCWNALIPVPPARLIVVEVYDCFPARLPKEGTSLRGKVTLSPAQLLELRQITRRQSGQQRRAYLHQQIYTDVKVDYSMSHHKADREDKEDNKITGQMIPRVLLSMTDMAATELPALTTSSSLLGRALRTTQLSYVVLRLLDRKARSPTTRVAGKRALWKNDSASIVVDESMLSEEPLHVQIWSERTALQDNLLGESRTRLDAVISAKGKPTPTTFEMGRPGHRHQGILSCSLSFERQQKSVEQHGSNASRNLAVVIGLAATINHHAEAASEATSRVIKRISRRKPDGCAGHIGDLARFALDEEICNNKGRRSKIFVSAQAAFLALANQRQAIVERKGDPSIVNSFGEELTDETYHAPHGGKAASEIENHITLSSSDAGVHSGVDSVTGMPWRANNSGFRCFFLGFPA